MTALTGQFSFAPFVGKAGSKACNTFGPDGIPDLVLKFNAQNVAAALGSVKDGQTVTLQLKGNLTNGKPIEGEDVIVIIRKK